ncbi:protein crumbs homolog 1-like isoform X2 [Rhopilema esculentum]|uniref:protein crumbs homolog 1-like isoform X2 n=1 Tax=Rhopilema esculentum TaxID=499914 RepID=UPI0031D0F276
MAFVHYCRLLGVFAFGLTVYGYMLRLPCKTLADFSIFHKGRRLSDNVLKKDKGLDESQCMMKCVEHRKCRSYNLNVKEKLCELNSKAHADNGTVLAEETDWTYKSTDYSNRLVGDTCMELQPCNDGVLCKDTCNPPFYECKVCDENHTGLHCDTPIDPNKCAENPCKNGGVCIDLFASYECNCQSGYTGKDCELATPCEEGQRIMLRNNFFCVKNAAKNKPTSQSSELATGASAKAVDGSRRSSYNEGSCTHTITEMKPWWQVDLEQKYDILGVNITNRSDCCKDRLRNFKVTVDSAQCYHVAGSLAEVIQTTLYCERILEGQLVKIQLEDPVSLAAF